MTPQSLPHFFLHWSFGDKEALFIPSSPGRGVTDDWMPPWGVADTRTLKQT